MYSGKDDSLSASQLRQRYKSMPDDQLSASQLRSRNCIASNKFVKEENSMLLMVVTAVFALVLVLLASVAMQSKGI